MQTCTKNTNVAAGVLPRGLAKISLGERVTYQSQNHLTKTVLAQVLIISKLQHNMSQIRMQTCTENTNVVAGVVPRGLAKISLGESVTYQSQNHLIKTVLAQVLIISKLQHNRSRIMVQTCTDNTNVAAGVLPRGLAKISLGESVTYQSLNHLTKTVLAQVLIISKLQHNKS
jgi:hypothetical protein